MSIVIGASASAGSVQGGGYIVVNLGASSQPVIDWTATAGTYSTGLGNTGWAALLGGSASRIDLLVAQTGLVVRGD
ncbi:hypothetical protein GGR74_002181 [Xanthomonas arboricola]